MIKTVACGISGGIDSAIAAYLLKKNNFDVIGVFMSNWDVKDETTECSTDKDREDAKYVCNSLKIPFHEVSFVKEYWNNVFESTLSSYKMACTPNPDILCNKHIKFDKFAKHCLNNLNVETFATGHYARSLLCIDGTVSERTKTNLLRRPRDKVKDQTFWLGQVDPQYLSKCIFPLCDITKPEVKQLGYELGLHKTLSRKESMGICFIGKRKFREFIGSYIEPTKGLFTNLDTGRTLGEHGGVHLYTLGQKSGLGDGQHAGYIAKLNRDTQEIFVVFNSAHPALFMKKVLTGAPHWLDSNPLNSTGITRLRLQYQNKYASVPCSIESRSNGTDGSEGGLSITLDHWFRCLSPGQYAVLYSEDDHVCLGSAVITRSISAYDEGIRDNIDWKSTDYENQYLFYPDKLHQRSNA